MPLLRQHFEQHLTGKQLNMLKHFDHLLKVSYTLFCCGSSAHFVSHQLFFH